MEPNISKRKRRILWSLIVGAQISETFNGYWLTEKGESKQVVSADIESLQDNGLIKYTDLAYVITDKGNKAARQSP